LDSNSKTNTEKEKEDTEGKERLHEGESSFLSLLKQSEGGV